jgi:hypothetical protein
MRRQEPRKLRKDHAADDVDENVLLDKNGGCENEKCENKLSQKITPRQRAPYGERAPEAQPAYRAMKRRKKIHGLVKLFDQNDSNRCTD